MSWQTGTSERFWRLRAAGKYDEAFALLQKQCACEEGDAEAEMEMVSISFYCHFDMKRDPMLHWKHLLRACELGHPAALLRRWFEEAPADNIPIMDNGDAITNARIMILLGGEREAAEEAFRAAMAGGSIAACVQYAVEFHHPKMAADLGDPVSCGIHGKNLLGTGVIDSNPLPELRLEEVPTSSDIIAEAMRYFEMGAAQGDRRCRKFLACIYFGAGDVADFRKGALLVLQLQSSEMPGMPYCLVIRCHLAKKHCNPWPGDLTRFNNQRCRELYVYGKQARSDATCLALLLGSKCLDVLRHYTNITTRARAAIMALWTALRYGGRSKITPRVPRDIALIICRAVWSSRETQTEVWA